MKNREHEHENTCVYYIGLNNQLPAKILLCSVMDFIF